jgi:hypothetical protein
MKKFTSKNLSTMKKTLLLASLFGLLIFGSCAKAIQAAQEEEAYRVMTTGEWYVSRFMEGPYDSVSVFTPYKFKFEKDGKVNTMQNATIVSSGTWSITQADTSINTYYPASVPSPVSKLNGKWRFRDAQETFVAASQTINGILYRLELRK